MKKIILASRSPRRHELLNLLGIEHEVISCKEDEKQLQVLDKSKSEIREKITKKTIEQLVLEVAYQKAKAWGQIQPEKHKKHLV